MRYQRNFGLKIVKFICLIQIFLKLLKSNASISPVTLAPITSVADYSNNMAHMHLSLSQQTSDQVTWVPSYLIACRIPLETQIIHFFHKIKITETSQHYNNFTRYKPQRKTFYKTIRVKQRKTYITVVLKTFVNLYKP